VKEHLLDVNSVQDWFTGNINFLAHIDLMRADGGRIFVSVVTLGEIEFGHNLTNSTNPARREEFERWIHDTFPPSTRIHVEGHDWRYYGQLKAEIFRRFPPRSAKENHPEMCLDPATGKELGIDENDLWIAAQAIARGMVLVSNDKMERVKEAAAAIQFDAGLTLDLQNWAKDPPSIR
jgi:tRNA(fMet)-specific endonuclease VapC